MFNKEMKNGVNTMLVVLVVILFIALVLLKCEGTKNRQQQRESIQLITALTDTLTSYKNKAGQLVSTIEVIQTQSVKDFLALQIKDSTIKQLQEVVKQYKGKLKPGSSVTNVGSDTEINTGGTTTITKIDTVRVDSLVYLYPTYTDSLKNKWVHYKVSMNKDSSKVSIRVHNEYSVVVGYLKKKPFVDVTTYNPYSTISTLRTYQVSIPKPKKFGVGINVSYSMTSNFQFQPTIGAGIQYNLIRF